MTEVVNRKGGFIRKVNGGSKRGIGRDISPDKLTRAREKSRGNQSAQVMKGDMLCCPAHSGGELGYGTPSRNRKHKGGLF